MTMESVNDVNKILPETENVPPSENISKLPKKKRKFQPDDPTKKRGYLMNKSKKEAKELHSIVLSVKRQSAIIPRNPPTVKNETSFAQELSKIEEELYGKSSASKH